MVTPYLSGSPSGFHLVSFHQLILDVFPHRHTFALASEAPFPEPRFVRICSEPFRGLEREDLFRLVLHTECVH